jgi:HTH-type transcriptional regulator/antitoxin HipB
MPIPFRTPRDIGLIIRDQRRTLGLPQGELAKRIGVSRQWLIEVEAGKARAELGLVLRTLNALGLCASIETESPPTPQAVDAIPFVDIDAILDDLKPDHP